MLTPYQFAGNMPIAAIDLDGLEPSTPAIIQRNSEGLPILITPAVDNARIPNHPAYLPAVVPEPYKPRVETIGLPREVKERQIVADYNAQVLKTVIADPQKLKEGDPLEWIGVLPVGKLFAKGGMLLKYVGAGMVVECTSKLMNKAGKPLEFILEKTGKWSKDAYRKNLERYTGITPGLNYHAHHTFPKAPGFADGFAKRGIDVNDPANLVWREGKEHLSDGKTAKQTTLWREYFKKDNGTETIQAARDRIEKAVFGNLGDVPKVP
jgi:hypothetical protein